ncbi:XrtA system polysaccharide deacetylase [Oceanicoccus sp. KOV_DT_Chl]|uniref:XrtA system polysaccharide deacetylase n=1 Tax=Oceanicoccus sp. KOV_DT_Chl TaxID=1904639 RepID=UPI000C7DA966|nr:XrtA system polysaccharide deacetylase [Oceanicoccus sp. KOV_DT_Chl]
MLTSQPPKKSVLHAMTIDVEDYYHVSAFNSVIKPDNWSDWPSRVEKNTHQLLDLFDTHAVKSTFFVLGWVADKYPSLVKELANRGHEIASHGWSHQLIYNQSPTEFKAETARSKDVIEELAQTPVTGYRAASYSITKRSLWALDILAELGFTWDSSIFPVHHDRYGISGSPQSPYMIQTSSGQLIKEFPLTTARVLGLAIPAAGGGYFRQYPYALSKWLFQRASQNSAKPLIFYLHPWEIDPEQPRVPGISPLSKFRHYTNLQRCETRLEQLLNDFQFGSVSQSLASTDIEIELNLHDF